MMNPRYAGIDRTSRPFVVTAAVGRQVPDRDDLMSLEQPRADMKTHSGADVVVTAATGDLPVAGPAARPVRRRHAGARERHPLRDRHRAARRRQQQRAEGHDPVEGHGPSGDIKAQGFRILDKGDTIIFTGQSDLLLKGAQAGRRPRPRPPALPAPIAGGAAQAAGEGRPPRRRLAAAAAGRSTAGDSPLPRTTPRDAHQAASRAKPPRRDSRAEACRRRWHRRALRAARWPGAAPVAAGAQRRAPPQRVEPRQRRRRTSRSRSRPIPGIEWQQDAQDLHRPRQCGRDARHRARSTPTR